MNLQLIFLSQDIVILYILLQRHLGGVCFYISVDIGFKPRNYLKIYEIKKIGSLFIEIINKNGSNAIVGVLYRHPSMDMDKFNDVKLELLLQMNLIRI